MKKKNPKNSTVSLAHVLYQKLGHDWYAFTEVDGDCFMSKVDADKIDAKAINEKNTSDSLLSFSNNKKRVRAA